MQLIGNCIYKLIDMVFKNKYKSWKFTYIDYFKLYAIISSGFINIKKCELKYTLI